MLKKIILDCDTCVFHQKFKARKDEPSDEGCNHPDWSGYVKRNRMTEMKNACGGIGYSATNYRHVSMDEKE